MNTRITVVRTGTATKQAVSQCPWIMDVPPEVNK